MKAILLVRVSTTVQELKEQEREVYELAVKDGYEDKDIIQL
jgi:DNA invertase Pin-like site-specific DNA recombinase